MKLYFLIHYVDMDGYLGRDNHPTPEDKGIVVALVSASSFTYSECALVGPGTPPEEDWETAVTCMRQDGTLVDLMPHEVRMHSIS